MPSCLRLVSKTTSLSEVTNFINITTFTLFITTSKLTLIIYVRSLYIRETSQSANQYRTIRLMRAVSLLTVIALGK